MEFLLILGISRVLLRYQDSMGSSLRTAHPSFRFFFYIVIFRRIFWLRSSFFPLFHFFFQYFSPLLNSLTASSFYFRFLQNCGITLRVLVAAISKHISTPFPLLPISLNIFFRQPSAAFSSSCLSTPPRSTKSFFEWGGKTRMQKVGSEKPALKLSAVEQSCFEWPQVPPLENKERKTNHVLVVF